jgi:hypothetical protein
MIETFRHPCRLGGCGVEHLSMFPSVKVNKIVAKLDVRAMLITTNLASQ